MIGRARIASVLIACACLLNVGLPSASAQVTKRCSNFLVGTAYFSKVRVTNVSCAKAKRLLDRTTLTANRGGAAYWRYGGWEWRISGVNETVNRIRGKRGAARITAYWGQT